MNPLRDWPFLKVVLPEQATPTLDAAKRSPNWPQRLARQEAQIDVLGERVRGLRVALGELKTLRSMEPSGSQEPPLAQAPPIDRGRLKAELGLAELLRELRSVELALGQLGHQQRTLARQGTEPLGKPHRRQEYTLYAVREAGRAGAPRLRYEFRTEPPWNGVPVPKPDGYRVVQSSEHAVPVLMRERRASESSQETR